MSEELKLPDLFQPCSYCRPLREAIEQIVRYQCEDDRLCSAQLGLIPQNISACGWESFDASRLSVRCKNCEGRGRILTKAGKQLIDAMRYAGMVESNGGANDRID